MVKLHAPVADASALLAAAAAMDLPLDPCVDPAGLPPGETLLLAFVPLDLALDFDDSQDPHAICRIYAQMVALAEEWAVRQGQTLLVVNLACTDAIEALHWGMKPDPAAMPRRVDRRPPDPLRALVALRLEQEHPGTLAASGQLDGLAGAAGAPGDYRTLLEQSVSAAGLLAGLRCLGRQERLLQEQAADLEAQRLEFGDLPDRLEHLTQELQDAHAAVVLLDGERRQRVQQQQRVRELESALEDLQRDLEQHAQLARKRAELLERCARASIRATRLQSQLAGA